MSDGELLYYTDESANNLKKALRPWAEVGGAVNDKPATMEDLAAMWLKTFGNNDSSSKQEDER